MEVVEGGGSGTVITVVGVGAGGGEWGEGNVGPRSFDFDPAKLASVVGLRDSLQFTPLHQVNSNPMLLLDTENHY